MLGIELSYAFSVIACCVVAAVIGWRHGRELSLGVGIALSLTAPTWAEIQLFGAPINVRVTVAIILLVAFCVHSPRRLMAGIHALDLVVVALFLWHIFVDIFHGRAPFESFAYAYGEWMLPYAAGRYALNCRENLTRLAPWFVIAAGVIAVAAIVESWSGVNLWECVFHPVDDRVHRSKSIRAALGYRAIGPTRHPIFLGTMLLTILPWVVTWGDRPSLRPKTIGMIALAGLIIVGGVAATVSRGPLLFLICGGGFALAVVSRWFGYISLVCIAVAALFASTNIGALADWFDEQTVGQSRARVVEAGDELLIQSSSRNRWVILKVYGPIFVDGGLLGYGSDAAEGFPPAGLPGLPNDSQVLDSVSIIDNSFLLTGLRLGWMGLGLLVATFLITVTLSLFNLSKASTYLFPQGRWTLIAIASSVFAVALELLTVYSDQDHMFAIFILIGLAGGIFSILRRASLAE